MSPEFSKAILWVVVGAAVALALAAIWAIKPEVDRDLDDEHTDAISPGPTPIKTVGQATGDGNHRRGCPTPTAQCTCACPYCLSQHFGAPPAGKKITSYEKFW